MSDSYRFYGNNRQIKYIASTVWAIRQQIKDRDIGDVIATSLDEQIYTAAQTLKLSVFLFSYNQPPYVQRKVSKTHPIPEKFVRANYKISDIKKSGLTWQFIKEACGGVEGYLWGRFRATARLSNGRQMQVYGGDAQTAQSRLQALARLMSSDISILTLTVAEEKPQFDISGQTLPVKATTRVYPGYFVVVNSFKINPELAPEAKPKQGFRLVKNKFGYFYVKTSPKIALWPTRQPINGDKFIQSALKPPT